MTIVASATYVEHSWSYVKVNGLTVNDGEERIAPTDYFNLSGEALDTKIKSLPG